MAIQTRTWCSWDSDRGRVYYKWDDALHVVTAFGWDNQSSYPQTIIITPNATGVPLPVIVIPAQGFTQAQDPAYGSIVLSSTAELTLPAPIAMIQITGKTGLQWTPPARLTCAG